MRCLFVEERSSLLSHKRFPLRIIIVIGHIPDAAASHGEHLILQMEEERGLDRAAAMAEMRFAFIKRLCDKTVVKPRISYAEGFADFSDSESVSPADMPPA